MCHCYRWFDAAQHVGELTEWFQRTRATSEHTYHCLDWFGGSESVSKAWTTQGYRAMAFDIKLSGSHDMVSRAGCYVLLEMAAQSLVLNDHGS